MDDDRSQQAVQSFRYATPEELEEAEIQECLNDIDWDQLLYEEETDGPEAYSYDSRNYASDDEARAALKALLQKSLEDGIRAARETPADQASE